MNANGYRSKQLRSESILLLCLMATGSIAAADTLSINTNNLILRNALIQSANSGSVKVEGHFFNNVISGEYNSMSIAATGASATAGNSQSGQSSQASTGSAISAMTVTAQNSGAIVATGSFQGNSLSGNHNSMTVQASGTSIVLSNVKR